VTSGQAGRAPEAWWEVRQAFANRLVALESVTWAALTHLEVDELLATLVERVRAAFDAGGCAILVPGDEPASFSVRAASGFDGRDGEAARAAQKLAGHVEARGAPVLAASLLAAPLRAGDELLGVVVVAAREGFRFFDEDVDLLQRAADRAAAAVKRAYAHEELKQESQFWRRVLAVASHELRAPVAALVAGAQMLADGSGQLEPERELEVRTLLATRAKRLASLVDQLLDVSRVKPHALEIRPERVPVREHLEQIVATVAPEPAQVRVDAPHDLAVEADPHVLDRVVSNLVVNALKHGREPVRVAAEPRDDGLAIAVEDSGAGVPAAVRPRLFEEFARGEAAGKGGAGLGLAIARMYATAHGGRLVHDDEFGPGARFEFVLPALRRETRRTPARAAVIPRPL
jgi:signal transduction histidine kinase